MKKIMMMAALLGFVGTQAVQAAVIAINFKGAQNTIYGIDPTATAFGIAAGDWVSGQRTEGASGTATFSDSVAAADLPAGVTASWTATGDWLIAADGTGAAPGEEEIAYGFLGDGGSGADLTFTGLGAWLAAEGASSYKIEYIYASNYNTGGLLNLTFADAPVYTSDGGSLLGTIDGGTQGDYTFYKGNTAVYYASSISGLTSDTLFIDAQARDGAVRGVLGGVVITPVPGPELELPPTMTISINGSNVLAGSTNMISSAVYTLQVAESLTATNWVDLATTSGVSSAEWEIPATNDVLFIRLSGE